MRNKQRSEREIKRLRIVDKFLISLDAIAGRKAVARLWAKARGAEPVFGQPTEQEAADLRAYLRRAWSSAS